jgi:hypothetical protein
MCLSVYLSSLFTPVMCTYTHVPTQLRLMRECSRAVHFLPSNRVLRIDSPEYTVYTVHTHTHTHTHTYTHTCPLFVFRLVRDHPAAGGRGVFARAPGEPQCGENTLHTTRAQLPRAKLTQCTGESTRSVRVRGSQPRWACTHVPCTNSYLHTQTHTQTHTHTHTHTHVHD